MKVEMRVENDRLHVVFRGDGGWFEITIASPEEADKMANNFLSAAEQWRVARGEALAARVEARLRSSPPVPHPAIPFVRHAAHGTAADDPRRAALRALLAGNARAAAALLVRAEASGRDLLQVRLALNHLPTPWVVACRAIEDAIAAGGPADLLRPAVQEGDPAKLLPVLVAAMAEAGRDGAPQAQRHLGDAFEAVEREAAGS